MRTCAPLTSCSQGRADSLLGAVQDAEDPADNVMLDRTGLQLPAEDVYEVRDSGGRLLGRSANWQGPDPEETASTGDHIYWTRINGRHYRVLTLHGLRVVDPDDKGGGTPRHVLVVYGAPTAQVWHQIRNAIVFFSLSNFVLLLVTGVLMAWLLHRGLAPMRRACHRGGENFHPSMELSAAGQRRRNARACPTGFRAFRCHAAPGDVLLAAAPFRK